LDSGLETKPDLAHGVTVTVTIPASLTDLGTTVLYHCQARNWKMEDGFLKEWFSFAHLREYAQPNPNISQVTCISFSIFTFT
jgi:hypothetical protein